MIRQPNYHIMSIGAVYSDRMKYDNYPPCQRERVWGPAIQQKLIDSILRGLHVPAIVAIRQPDLFGLRYEVVDGQQRLKTIFDFLGNKLKTLKYSDEPGMSPIEPDRLFRELTPSAQAAFVDYPLQMCVLEGTDHNLETIGLMYRRLQYQMKLTGAEKLFSYNSETRETAIVIAKHPVWDAIYGGKTDRKQPFQMGVSIILLELAGGFANLTTPRLKDVASGQKDSLLNSGLAARVDRRLTALRHILNGATLTGMNEIIPVYQATILLEEAGYDLLRSDEGCIAGWFMQYKEQALETQRQFGYKDGFSVLAKVGMQARFWGEQREALLSMPGLFRRDPKRLFNRLDKITAWNRQKGVCPVCGRPVKIQDVGHHTEWYTNGGKTVPENCTLVHTACHDSFHAIPKEAETVAMPLN